MFHLELKLGARDDPRSQFSFTIFGSQVSFSLWYKSIKSRQALTSLKNVKLGVGGKEKSRPYFWTERFLTWRYYFGVSFSPRIHNRCSFWIPLASRRRELRVPQAWWGFPAGLGRAGNGKPQTLEVCSGPTWLPALGRCSANSRINDAGTGLSYSQHCSGLSSFQRLDHGRT